MIAYLKGLLLKAVAFASIAACAQAETPIVYAPSKYKYT